MRAIIIYLVTLVTAVAIACTPQGDDDTSFSNLVLNRSFEDGVAGWSAGENSVLTGTSGPALDGQPAIEAEAVAEGPMIVRTRDDFSIRVEPREFYTASVHVSPSSTARPARVWLRFYDEDGEVLGTSIGDPVDAVAASFVRPFVVARSYGTAAFASMHVEWQSARPGERHRADAAKVEVGRIPTEFTEADRTGPD